MEEWKDIVGYKGLYQVSNLGNVRRLKKDGNYKNLKNSIWGKYYMIELSLNSNKKKEYVHRLVAKHFVPNPSMSSVVNHIDGNELNNNSTNLEWCNDFENLIHASKTMQHHPFGKQPKRVIQKTLDDKLICEYESIGEACRQIGVSNARAHISECCSGKIVSAYGYKWEYAN